MCDSFKPDSITCVIQMFLKEVMDGTYVSLMGAGDTLLVAATGPRHVWLKVSDGYVWVADMSHNLSKFRCDTQVDLSQPDSLQLLQSMIEESLNDW